MRMCNFTFSGTKWLAVLLFATALSGGVPLIAGAATRASTKAANRSLSEEVRHQLVLLPWYSVFDNLEFQIKDGNEVVLSGQVVQPVLKSDAAKAVNRVSGVSKVEDKIQVLPVSPYDNRLRIAEFRAIYDNDQLYRYALQAVPPIHIIVDNGRVTLIGIVATKSDKDVAGIMANEVPGVFGVTNDLTVEQDKGKSH